MSGSRGGKQSPVRLIISALITIGVAGVIVGWGLRESAEYQRQADYHAAEYAAYTYDKVGNGCLRLSPFDKQDCLAKAVHERRENQRQEQDLVAQRQSALWAYIMGAAAVVGMALSAIGVALVYTTFSETRRSADAAVAMQRFAYYDYAPWLHVVIEGHGSIPGVEEGEFRFHFQLRNRGKTYAQRALLTVRLANSVGDIELHTGPMHHRPMQIPGEPNGGYGIPVSGEMTAIRRKLGSGFDVEAEDWKLIFDFSYTDIWGGEWEAREVYTQHERWLKAAEGGYHRQKN